MWALANQTPFAAERNWVRDKHGAHHWVVALRASFAIGADGAPAPAEEQPAPLLEPSYHGKPGASSLRCDSDLLAVRPGTDIVLDAWAHVPGGRAAPRVVSTLRVGELQKTLMVQGERYFRRGAGGLTVTEPEAFTSRPIRYELAYGGWDKTDPDSTKQRLDPRNPIGRGFAVRSEHLVDHPAPVVQYPDGDIARRGPAGFGPVDPAWSPRRELAGTYDDGWAKSKRPLLADDYDERFAMSAPVDQQVIPALRGGESVELVNLTPGGKLVFQLPRRYFTFSTQFAQRAEEHRARISCVFIEPERSLVSVVWQTSLPVGPADVDYLDLTVITEKAYVR
jgi:hypothetical protein